MVQNGQDTFECNSNPLPYTVCNPVVTGHKFSCRLNSTGAVKCWGYNDKGQLGQEDNDSRGNDPNEMGDRLSEIDLGS